MAIIQQFSSCRSGRLHAGRKGQQRIQTIQRSRGGARGNKKQSGIVRTGNAEGSEEASGQEGPVADPEPLAAGVEGDVGVRALGVVVRRGEAGAGGVEASAGDQGGRGAGGGAGEHLRGEGVSWSTGEGD